MTDNWDDGEDDWDVDDDALDAKLGLKKDDNDDGNANNFDDEEDLALKEKAAQERADNVELKKKGSALAADIRAGKKWDQIEPAIKAELEAYSATFA